MSAVTFLQNGCLEPLTTGQRRRQEGIAAGRVEVLVIKTLWNQIWRWLCKLEIYKFYAVNCM